MSSVHIGAESLFSKPGVVSLDLVKFQAHRHAWANDDTMSTSHCAKGFDAAKRGHGQRRSN